MNYQELFQLSFWQNWLHSDFNRGYALGAGCVVGLLLIYFLLRIVIFLLFRTHRCSAIEVRTSSGVVLIDREAVERSVRQQLVSYPELSVRAIKLYVRGKNYQLRMFCSFADQGKGLPELLDTLKPEIRQKMSELFGVTTLRRIDVKVEEFLPGEKSPLPEKNEAAVAVPAVPYGSGPLL